MKMERLNEILKEKRMSRRKLERDAGLGVGTIAKWKTTNPTNQNLEKISKVLNVSVAYLTGESDFRSEQDALIHKWNEQMSAGLPDQVRRIEAGIRIPVLGSVPCGIPIDAIEFLDTEDWEEISEVMSRSGRFFGLKVKGDSMSPNIQKGDIVIVRSQSTADSGDIVIVRMEDNRTCCKKLIIRDDGIVLHSFNPAYDPLFFPKDSQIEIIGKVMEIRRKL